MRKSVCMITIFVGDCNHISQSFYDSVINNLQLHQLKCPCGHSCCLRVHAYYIRSVKTGTGRIKLRVLRVICSECGHTHAILLSSIVPYSQTMAADQQCICMDYGSGSNPYEICDRNPLIDENNVKSVILNFRRHWKEKLRSLRIKLSPIDNLVRSCFADYSMQFMQIRPTPNILFMDTT